LKNRARKLAIYCNKIKSKTLDGRKMLDENKPNLLT